jgi:hypothetical protein
MFNSQVQNGLPDGTLIHNDATLTYPTGTITKVYDLTVHR